MITIEQEPDRVPHRPLVTSAVVVLVAIAASVAVVILLAGRNLGLALDNIATQPTPSARIETEPFAVETASERLQRAAVERLETWGWVDRTAGRIHVPLDVAIEIYLAEEQP